MAAKTVTNQLESLTPVRKQLASARWGRIVPIAFITYSLAYLDRANYSFGAASGLATDLHITPSIASLLGALFFLGYFIFQVPGGIYTEKHSCKKLVFWSLIFWSIFAIATGMVRSVTPLYAIRLLLGVAESVVMPAMLIYLSHWFTKRERAKANNLLILGNPITVLWMSVLSGYLCSAYGWRVMFIVEGIPSIIWAFIWWKLFVDRPRDAKWLTENEKVDLEAALSEEQEELKPIRNYGEAFKNRKILGLSFVHFFWNIGMYGFIMWLPSILKSASDIGIVETGWLTAVPYALAVLFMLSASYYSDRTQHRKLVVVTFLLAGAICFIGSFAIGSSNFWLSYVLLAVAGACMYTPYGSFFAAIPEVIPKNVSGGATALIVSFGALGSFVGVYMVGYLNGATGSSSASYVFMAVSLLIAVVLAVTTKFSTTTSTPTMSEPEAGAVQAAR